MTLLILAVATGVAGLLVHSLRIGEVATVFLAAVLLVAVVSGLAYGLAAAAAAWVAYHVIFKAPTPMIALGDPDTLPLALFAAGVVITGAFTDVRRRRDRRARAPSGPAEARRPTSPGVMGARHARSGSAAAAIGRSKVFEEAKRALVSALIVGAGLAAGALARDALGYPAAMLAVLASVLAAASLGARFGFAAGVFAGLVLNAVLGGTAASVQGALQAGFSLFMFAAMGWGVGALADRLEARGRLLETLMDAARRLSASSDEAAIRRDLLDGLARVAAGAAVRVSDENGADVLAAPGSEAADAVAGSGRGDDTARAMRLAAHEREMGSIAWRFPRSAGGEAQAVAATLAELGAAAIVRARLGVENAQMEFVARTEHLRTILLDAVSHHFRSPLAGIMGSVTSILNLPEQHDRGVRRELLLIIKEQANRLNRYVDNFLSVARLESGSIDVNLSDLNIEPLIYDVWETFGEAGGARRFLRVNLGPEQVRADPSLLTQILGNVFENAIKYSPPESVVDVRGRREGGRLVIEVADQGCGVPAESQGRIFDRFFRSQGAKAPGLGLGLYISRSLVEMLDGSMDARNRSDGEQGLVVSINLPLADGAR